MMLFFGIIYGVVLYMCVDYVTACVKYANKHGYKHG